MPTTKRTSRPRRRRYFTAPERTARRMARLIERDARAAIEENRRLAEGFHRALALQQGREQEHELKIRRGRTRKATAQREADAAARRDPCLPLVAEMARQREPAKCIADALVKRGFLRKCSDRTARRYRAKARKAGLLR